MVLYKLFNVLTVCEQSRKRSEQIPPQGLRGLRLQEDAAEVMEETKMGSAKMLLVSR